MDRDKIDSIPLRKAMEFFNLLGERPFVCLVMESETSYHLFTKGTEEEVTEMRKELQRNA